jgi:hypothetical protein
MRNCNRINILIQLSLSKSVMKEIPNVRIILYQKRTMEWWFFLGQFGELTLQRKIQSLSSPSHGFINHTFGALITHKALIHYGN